MSYEIVKNLKVKQDLDGSFIAVINCASNNVYPRHYANFEYGKNEGWTKEQLEKELLLDFYKGNLQGGSSKYRKIARLANTLGYLKEGSRIDDLQNKLYRHLLKTNNEKRKQEIQNTINRLCEKADVVVKEGLYKCLKNEDINRLIKFVVRKMDCGQYLYITKVNKSSYKYGWKEHIFTDYLLYNELLNAWWVKEGGFEVVRL